MSDWQPPAGPGSLSSFAALIVLAFAPTNLADHRAAALTAAKKEGEVLLTGRVLALTGGGANR